MKVADLAKVIQIITDEEILDKKAKEAVDGFSALGQLREGKEISCVFNFEDGKYPLVAYLDQSYFRCSEDNFVGESYLLCKIIRKVQKGQSVKLDMAALSITKNFVVSGQRQVERFADAYLGVSE